MYKILFLFIIIFGCLFSQNSKLFTSPYIGFGIGPNIGGALGIGFEKEIKSNFSFNVAIGSLHPVLNEKTDFSKISFDFGLKYYFHNTFIGANYGFLEYEINSLVISGEELSDFEEKKYGISLSIGYKFKLSKHLRLSLFLAKWINKKKKSTGSKLTDDIVAQFENIPMFGLLLGYNL